MQIEESRSSQKNRKNSFSLDQSYLGKCDVSGIFSLRNELLKLKYSRSINNLNFITYENKTLQNCYNRNLRKNTFLNNSSEQAFNDRNNNNNCIYNNNIRKLKVKSKFKFQNNFVINLKFPMTSSLFRRIISRSLAMILKISLFRFQKIENNSFNVIDSDDEFNKNLQKFNLYNNRNDKLLNTFNTKNENINSVKSYSKEIFNNKNHFFNKKLINNYNSINANNINNYINNNNNYQNNLYKQNSDFSNYSIINDNQIIQNIKSINVKMKSSFEGASPHIDFNNIKNDIKLNNNIIINKFNLQ